MKKIILFIIICINILCDDNRLFEAILYDKTDEAIKLIDEGADVNIQYEESNPLFLAVYKNNIKVAKALIAKGADVNKENNLLTPLLIVAFTSENQLSIEMAKLLIESGADVNQAPSSDPSGSVLTSALINKSNPEFIYLLIDSGANLNKVDSTGKTPLMRIALSGNTNRDSIKIARYMIKHGAKITRAQYKTIKYSMTSSSMKELIESTVNRKRDIFLIILAGVIYFILFLKKRFMNND